MLLLIDGMSVLKTVSGPLMGLHNGIAYSFMQQVNSLVKKHPFIDIICCWEDGTGDRKELLPDYKSQRTSSGSRVHEARNQVKALMTHVGALHAIAVGHEADDAIGILSSVWKDRVIIYSNDQDMRILVNNRVSLWQKVKITTENKKAARTLITDKNFQDLVAYRDPAQYLVGKTMMGDGSDRIPGLDGVGEITIQQFFDDTLRQGAQRTKIEDFLQSPEYQRNLQLMDIRGIRPGISIELSDKLPDRAKALQLLTELGFASIYNKFDYFWSIYDKIHSPS